MVHIIIIIIICNPRRYAIISFHLCDLRGSGFLYYYRNRIIVI